MFKILVVEDDKALNQLFCTVLTKAEYQVLAAHNGIEALSILKDEYIDLVVCDVMMPVMDGFALIDTMRTLGFMIPVLIITAKVEFDAMQKGYEVGTDDYMIKPVNMNEMLLRVRALLKRAQMATERRQVFGKTVLEYDTSSVVVDGRTTLLPQKEFMILYKLASHAGKIFTRQQLMDEIWGQDSMTDPHTVDVHINRLRDRLRDNNDINIVTVRGIGYKAVREHG